MYDLDPVFYFSLTARLEDDRKHMQFSMQDCMVKHSRIDRSKQSNLVTDSKRIQSNVREEHTQCMTEDDWHPYLEIVGIPSLGAQTEDVFSPQVVVNRIGKSLLDVLTGTWTRLVKTAFQHPCKNYT